MVKKCMTLCAFVLLLFELLFGLTASIEVSNLTISLPMLRSSVKSEKREAAMPCDIY